jgi:hypothetical protein
MSRPVRRILLALDPAAPREEAWAALGDLTDLAGAEVTALYVEDEDVRRLADLPGITEVRWGAASPRRLEPAALAEDVGRTADAVRRLCERAAALRGARLHFRTARGEVLAELSRASREADLLVVARALRSAGARTWHGAAPERLAARLAADGAAAPPDVLFVNEPWDSGSAVVVLAPADAAGDHARALAAALAQAAGLPLEVLPADTDPSGLPARARRARVLVLPWALARGAGSALATLVTEARASLLLCR